MASIRTQFSVGLFVIVGLAIVAITVVWLGMSHYLEKGQFYVAYFDESVQGLDRDSPVKYRGVTIGRVESLGVAPDGTLIQAVLKIDSDLKPGKDWVAQLKSVGITGLMFIELDRKKPGDPDSFPKIDFPSKHPVIETIPSGVKKFVEGLDDVLEQIRSMNLVDISNRLRRAIDTFNTAVEGARIDQVSEDLRASFRELEKMLGNPRWEKILENVETAASSVTELSRTASSSVTSLGRSADRTVTAIGNAVAGTDQRIGAVSDQLLTSIAAFRKAVGKFDAFFSRGETFIDRTDEGMQHIERQLSVTLQSLRAATENLNRLAEEISAQPSRLFFSEPPETGSKETR